ncbi:unnamed protein product, partial [Medioppia subpectinata]
ESVETPCDAVIYGTGYHISYPFLPDELRPELNANLWLYKGVFNPHLKHAHTLAITSVGLVTGASNPLVEQQSRYFALLMADRCRLPSEKRMLRDNKRQKAYIIKHCPTCDKTAIQMPFIKYLDELGREMGVKPRLWKYAFTDPKLWYRLYFGPCVPYQYRLNGPNAWPDAREAIMTVNHRIRAPFKTRADNYILKTSTIIGAGQSGLGAFNACREQHFDAVVVYERSDSLCGLWANREGNDGLMSCEGCPRLLPTTTLNSSKEMTAYSDFPFPKHYPNYVHHSLMREYLLLYAERIGIKDHVKLRHELIGCQQNADYDRTGQWRLTVRDIDNDRVFDEVFDGVIVCTGRYHRPIIPDIKNRHLYAGRVVHTNALSDTTGFEGQRVVVFGVGNTGIDTAIEMSKVCAKVHLSCRTGCWVWPRVGPHGLPSDVMGLRRWIESLSVGCMYPLASWVATTYINAAIFNHNLYGLKPRHRVFSQSPILSDDLHKLVIRGAIIMKTNIQQFTATGVIFEGETVETPCDAVIYATGYHMSLPYLPDELRPELNPNLKLYKHIFNPHLKHAHTLAITSRITPFGAALPTLEQQSRYFALLMADRCRLPSEKRMLRDIKRWKAWVIRHYPTYDKYSTYFRYIKYMDELADEMGVKPRLWKYAFTDPKLWWRLYFGPCVSYQYRLNGPNAWPDAREAIMTVNHRIRAPFKTYAHN